eukprot:SAG31_NODE_15010_length_775_cov_3.541420_1_plen_178_part_10
MASFLQREAAREEIRKRQSYEQHGFSERGPAPWTVESLAEAVYELGIASSHQVAAMRRHLTSGRYGLQHYVAMYASKIEAAALARYSPDQNSWTEDAFLGALSELGLANSSAIATMKRNLATGRFPLRHYAAMWQPQIALATLTHAARVAFAGACNHVCREVVVQGLLCNLQLCHYRF